ncbi:MAG: heparinase II/III family protein [Alphaproteobacteria bacterium]|nr:heparinase II/III family protein [Alphaproteobacteria bacterium]
MAIAQTPASSPGRPKKGAKDKTGGSLRAAYFASPFYRLRLIGRSPADLAAAPPDPWPGDADLGQEIVRKSAVFLGEREPVGDNWIALSHDFEWLAHLRALGTDDARRRARQLVRAWILAYGMRPVADCWQSECLGARIVNWLSHFVFFCASAEPDYRALFFRSLARQARHLARVADQGPTDARRLTAIKGSLYAAACLPGFDRLFRTAVRRLEREIARQILADGGHLERSPARQLAVLRDLVDIRATLASAQREIPLPLQSAIDRMAPVLRTFRHGDGGLAQFNGSREGDAALVAQILARADADGRPPVNLPHTGFQRLSAGGTTVIFDTGAFAPVGADASAHAGTLAFEMSDGPDRLVVNCGGYAGAEPEWSQVARATAAHSTLIVDDTNSSEVLPEGGLGQRPTKVTMRRQEIGGATRVEAHLDGYGRMRRLVHRRRLELSADGSELRGRDSVAGKGGKRLAIRFHMHPKVRAEAAPEPNSLLLHLPSQGVWRLDAAGAELSLEDSVYLGAPGGICRTKQAVISRDIDGAATHVDWRILRQA